MVKRTKIRRTRMWTHDNLRSGLYLLKSENPDKTLTDIQKEIGKQIKDGKIKLSKFKNDFWE